MMEVPCVGMYYPDVVLPHYQHLVAKKKKTTSKNKIKQSNEIFPNNKLRYASLP